MQYVWDSLTPGKVREVFHALGIDWWVGGGIAIDLFVGRETRKHGDLDVAILRRDVAALTPLLAVWDVCIAHDGKLTPWDGGALLPEQHQFWVRRRGTEPWAFEILLEVTKGSDWLYRRDGRVRRPLASIGRTDPRLVPYLRAELCLLYKSNRLAEQRNADDFETVLPLLDEAARGWLIETLTLTKVGHPWIDRLR